jgi:transcriptional regulator with XRE-family HTH domain
MTDNELGAFLRGRREAITPDSVGLPIGFRRRTPGLRRAELATIAGVSVDYLTRLEQGRDRHPSAQVLGVLADALRMSPEERVHLRRITKSNSGYTCMVHEPPGRDVRPTVRALLATIEPAPAYVINRLTEIIAFSDGFRRLAEPLGLLDTDPPNLLRYVFTNPRARAVYTDWDNVADEQVAALRVGSHPSDPYVAELIDELTITAGTPFTQRLTATPRLPQRTGVERVRHPTLGDLTLPYETLELPDTSYDQRLIIWLPAATAPQLRAVSG